MMITSAPVILEESVSNREQGELSSKDKPWYSHGDVLAVVVVVYGQRVRNAFTVTRSP